MKVASPGAGELTLVPSEREMTIQDLLRHTSGLTYRDRGTTAAHKLYPGSSISASIKLSREEFLAALAPAFTELAAAAEANSRRPPACPIP